MKKDNTAEPRMTNPEIIPERQLYGVSTTTMIKKTKDSIRQLPNAKVSSRYTAAIKRELTVKRLLAVK
jgi:hypothetical protein